MFISCIPLPPVHLLLLYVLLRQGSLVVSFTADFLLHTHILTHLFFFFNDTATTEIYTLSLHDALPIYNREKLNLTVAGIWIDSDESVELVGHEANLFPLIAVNFPIFTDGRGFSIARLLRERYEFNGQLRAIGNPIQDQLFYLKRCGFTSFDLKEGTNLEAAISSLDDFDKSYQGAIIPPEPLFILNSLENN